tara:strand:- start:187 stop:507 length:321 start_codon:yes stop_codon:yes gene_type:complete
MAQYNLTDNLSDSFTFKLGDLEYSFRYPTTKEMRKLSEMNQELQQLIQKNADEKVIKKKSKASETEMNQLVTPVGHENPISEVLEDQPINVVRNFRKMMAKEINLE